MTQPLRHSAIDFGVQPRQSEIRNGWRIALDYETDASTRLIDLSHVPKWNLQDRDLAVHQPWGLSIPTEPGACTYERGILISRRSPTRCAVWHLKAAECDPPAHDSYTDITDGLVLLALSGRQTLALMERMSNLDLSRPDLKAPSLLQGPVMHLACQVVLLSRDERGATVLLAFPRGYGRSLARALLQESANLGISPGGINEILLP